MRVVHAVLSILLATALGCSSERALPEVFVLRLSTHQGLAEMQPGRLSSFTAQLQDLVYDTLGAEFERLSIEGEEVRLCPAADPRLAAALRHADVVATRLRDGCLVARLRTPEAAAGWDLELAVLDRGPYAAESWVENRELVLRRRVPKPGAPGRIVVTNVPREEEEWRLLLGRRIDLVPLVRASHARRLAELHSIRLVRFAETTHAVLFVQAGPTGVPVPLRHAISQALRRRALAAVAGVPGAEVEMDEDRERARAFVASAGPVTLRLVAYAGDSELQRVALLIQEQLAAAGMRVEIVTPGMDDLLELVENGAFELLLFTQTEERKSYRLLSTSEGNLGRYASPAYDAAIASGRTDEAEAVLHRDLPLIPLFELTPVVAVDRSLCGVAPRTLVNFGWLADVRRCRPGERE